MINNKGIITRYRKRSFLTYIILGWSLKPFACWLCCTYIFNHSAVPSALFPVRFPYTNKTKSNRKPSFPIPKGSSYEIHHRQDRKEALQDPQASDRDTAGIHSHFPGSRPAPGKDRTNGPLRVYNGEADTTEHLSVWQNDCATIIETRTTTYAER